MGSINGTYTNGEDEYDWPDIPNPGAPNTPYYTPIQHPPAGTARDPGSAAALFRPLKIRGLELQNRIFVSHRTAFLNIMN